MLTVFDSSGSLWHEALEAFCFCKNPSGQILSKWVFSLLKKTTLKAHWYKLRETPNITEIKCPRPPVSAEALHSYNDHWNRKFIEKYIHGCNNFVRPPFTWIRVNLSWNRVHRFAENPSLSREIVLVTFHLCIWQQERIFLFIMCVPWKWNPWPLHFSARWDTEMLVSCFSQFLLMLSNRLIAMNRFQNLCI